MISASPIKINFYAGKEEAQEAYTFCQKHYGQSDLDKANVQVVLGGDGSVLTALRKQLNLNLNIPIFALNYGSRGFLANDASTDDLYERIKNAQAQTICPLKMTMTSSINGQKKEIYAFNEFSVLRASPQSVHLPVFLKNEEMKFSVYLEGDGFIVATPMGSNAYYSAMGGEPLKMSNKGMLIRSINTVKSIDFLMSEKTKLAVAKYQGKKRPIMIEGDGQRFENVSRGVIEYAFDKRKTLLFETLRQNQR